MTFRRVLFTAVGWLAGAVLLLGAVQRVNPLTGIACGIGLTSLIASVALARRLQPSALKDVARKLGLAMIIGMIGLFCVTMALGGGALGGRLEDGIYYLRNHDQETRVGASVYYFVAAYELLLFGLWPAGMTLNIKANNYGEEA